MTFEEYLKSQGATHHLLVSSVYPKGETTFFIHPLTGDEDGEMPFFRVKGNKLTPITVPVVEDIPEGPDNFPNEQDRD